MVPISLNECESLKVKGLGGMFDLLRDSRVVARSKTSGPGEVAEVREDGEVEIYGFLVMILENECTEGRCRRPQEGIHEVDGSRVKARDEFFEAEG